MRRILIVAATPHEIEPLIRFLKHHFAAAPVNNRFQDQDLLVDYLITGVGSVATAFSLSRQFALHRYDLAVNGGIAGAIDPTLHLGEVTQVVSDSFGDLGAEDRHGNFIDLFEMKLLNDDEFPFTQQKLINPSDRLANLRSVMGITVNKIHGCEESIRKLKGRTNAQIETMESAAFFYTCLQNKSDFVAIRAISNYVEPRNRDHWQIPLAIGKLNEALIDALELKR